MSRFGPPKRVFTRGKILKIILFQKQFDKLGQIINYNCQGKFRLPSNSVLAMQTNGLDENKRQKYKFNTFQVQNHKEQKYINIQI